MKYQLVLQFQADSVEDFDRLVAFEEKLIAILKGLATVDGHDFGSGECNLFVHTDEPIAAFERVREASQREQIQTELRAAYRENYAERFVILWPPALTQFSVK